MPKTRVMTQRTVEQIPATGPAWAGPTLLALWIAALFWRAWLARHAPFVPLHWAFETRAEVVAWLWGLLLHELIFFTLVFVLGLLTPFGLKDAVPPGMPHRRLAAVLTGLAFALPITAWSSTRYGGASFPTIIRFGLLPMFLFGGAFFPITELPGWLQPVAYVTPLWHGIELCRGAVIDSVSAGNVAVHLAVLGAYILGGWAACRVTFARRLAP